MKAAVLAEISILSKLSSVKMDTSHSVAGDTLPYPEQDRRAVEARPELPRTCAAPRSSRLRFFAPVSLWNVLDPVF